MRRHVEELSRLVGIVYIVASVLARHLLARFTMQALSVPSTRGSVPSWVAHV